MRFFPSAVLLFLTASSFPLLTAAQFGQFFEQMFSGGSGARHQHQRHPGGGEQQNVPSDADWYRSNYESATCSDYLCPSTLSCVTSPSYCPCAFPDHEERFILTDAGSGTGGSAAVYCLSKSLGGAQLVHNHPDPDDTAHGGNWGVNLGWESVAESIKKGGASYTANKMDMARRGLI